MTGHPSGLVSQEWQDLGVWLSLAWQIYGPLDQVGRASLAAKRFAELCDGETPEMNLMSSGVEFPQWRKARRSPHDEVWAAFVDYCITREAAEADVDKRLRFGSLLAFGDPQHRGADPVWAPVRAWHGLKRDPDQRDVIRGENLVYYYVRVVSAEQWQWSLAAKQAPDHLPIQPPPSEEVAADAAAAVVEVPAAPARSKPESSPANSQWQLRGVKLKVAFDAWLEELKPRVPGRREAQEHGLKHKWLIEEVRDLHSEMCEKLGIKPGPRPAQPN